MVKLMCGMLIWLPCEVPVTWMHQAHFGMCEEVKINESRTLHCTRHSLLSDQFLSHPILRIVLLLQNMQASEAWFQSTCADPFCMNALLISRTWTSLPSALRPQSILTFLSLPGQPPVGVSFCGTKSHLVERRQDFQILLLFLDIHFNCQKKNYHMRQSFRLFMLSFLISWRINFMVNYFMCCFCSFLIMIEIIT